MKCPGQDTLYWKPGAIFEVNCPNCDSPVEFFKDDTSRKCRHCGQRFVNPKMDFGCAAYCPYAEQCLGTLPEEVRARREDLLKDRVAVEMKRTFNRDFKRIGRAMRRMRYVERMAQTSGAILPVVLCAACLWEIGAPAARKEYGGVSGGYLATENAATARALLGALQADEPLIDAVCAIVGHRRTPESAATQEFMIVHDAEWVVRTEDRIKLQSVDADRLRALISAELLTAAGKEQARAVLLR